MLPWLWCRPAAVALIRPLAWELPYTSGAALKKNSDNKYTVRLVRLIMTRRRGCWAPGRSGAETSNSRLELKEKKDMEARESSYDNLARRSLDWFKGIRGCWVQIYRRASLST